MGSPRTCSFCWKSGAPKHVQGVGDPEPGACVGVGAESLLHHQEFVAAVDRQAYQIMVKARSIEALAKVLVARGLIDPLTLPQDEVVLAAARALIVKCARVVARGFMCPLPVGHSGGCEGEIAPTRALALHARLAFLAHAFFCERCVSYTAPRERRRELSAGMAGMCFVGFELAQAAEAGA